jgi:hypothetical protein
VSGAAAPRATLAEPVRSRSRSLSITLAQEREREQQQREGSVGAKRKVLNREISMKRAFKPRERDPKSMETERREKERAEEKRRSEEAKLTTIKEEERNLGVTLVAATPVKSKVRSVAARPGSKITMGRRTPEEDERGLSPDILLMGT